LNCKRSLQITENDGKVENFTLNIGYDYFSVEEVLKRCLPNNIKEIPSSFEQIGHIAHLNLRDEVFHTNI
jgi:tRNA (guanine37-N1)-methyltransferase